MVQSLQDSLSAFLEYVPQLIGAIIILIVGYLIARALQAAVERLLRAVGFDRWMERGGIKQFFDRAETRETPATVLGTLVFWLVFIVAIAMATDALGIRQVSVVLSQLIAYIPNVIAAILILILAALLANFVAGLVRGATGVDILGTVAQAAIIVYAAFAALTQLGIAVQLTAPTFLIILGAVALAAAIAFGLGSREVAQDIVERAYERRDELAGGDVGRGGGLIESGGSDDREGGDTRATIRCHAESGTTPNSAQDAEASTSTTAPTARPGDPFAALEERYSDYHVYDRHYEKIGKVDDLLVDENDQPEYIGVKMGFFGARSTLIPMEIVRVNDRRELVEVAADKEKIKNGPTFGDERDITPEFEQQVRGYYGVETMRTEERGAYGAYYATDATGSEGVDLRPGERLKTEEGVGEEQPAGATADVAREREASRVRVHKRTRGVR
jgi:Conserved TM helix/PRC-barrel domain